MSLKTPALVFLTLALVLSACNYQTIGGGTMPPPPSASGQSSSKGLTAPTKKPQALGPKAPTTPPKDAIFCRLSDLTPAATWEVNGQDLAGSLTLANYWPTTCAFVGQPTLNLTDSDGGDYHLQVTAPTPPSVPPTFMFKENTVAEIRFTWSNWCGPDPTGGMRVAVAMPKVGEPALYVPVQDQNGNLLSNFPPCQNKGKPSTLRVETLRILK